MDIVLTIVVALHVFFSVSLIVLVLLQQGRGADAGAAFGSGASSTFFGAAGSGNFLSRSTAVVVTAFFLTSLFLTYLVSHNFHDKKQSVMDSHVVSSAPKSLPHNRSV